MELILVRGYFFAIRVKDGNTRCLLAADSLPGQMDRPADVMLIRSKARRKRLHPELESFYRCICKAVPFDFFTDSRSEYRMRLRVVRFQIAEGVYEKPLPISLRMSFHWNRSSTSTI